MYSRDGTVIAFFARIGNGGPDEGREWVTYSERVPGKRIVCPTCHGEGTHPNPNIDGFTLDEWGQMDQHFKDHYMAGAYDVECYECSGRNVVDVVDWDALSYEQKEQHQKALDLENQYYWEFRDEERRGC